MRRPRERKVPGRAATHRTARATWVRVRAWVRVRVRVSVRGRGRGRGRVRVSSPSTRPYGCCCRAG